MPWHDRSRSVGCLLALDLAGFVSGCAQWITPSLASDPYATGTWTGRVVCVMTGGYGGARYPAVGIDLEKGPRVLKGSSGEFTVDPHRDLVLLVRGQRIIDPSELRLSPGSQVRVSGRLCGVSPIKELSDGTGTGVTVVSPDERNPNLAIDIGRGKPEVLRD